MQRECPHMYSPTVNLHVIQPSNFSHDSNQKGVQLCSQPRDQSTQNTSMEPFLFSQVQ